MWKWLIELEIKDRFVVVSSGDDEKEEEEEEEEEEEDSDVVESGYCGGSCGSGSYWYGCMASFLHRRKPTVAVVFVVIIVVATILVIWSRIQESRE